MNTFTLEKGVPETYYGRSAQEAQASSSREVVIEDRFPWAEMEVGESFRASAKDAFVLGLQSSTRVQQAMWFLAREAEARLGRHFVVRVDKQGARVWRVASRVKSKRGRPMKYPWTTIEVGEAFVMSMPSEKSARPIVNRAGLMYGRSFSVSKQDSDWRVERVA